MIVRNTRASQDKCISDQSKEAHAFWRNFSYNRQTKIFRTHNAHVRFHGVIFYVRTGSRRREIQRRRWADEIRGTLMIHWRVILTTKHNRGQGWEGKRQKEKDKTQYFLLRKSNKITWRNYCYEALTLNTCYFESSVFAGIMNVTRWKLLMLLIWSLLIHP
jgi:hypothetical protein